MFSVFLAKGNLHKSWPWNVKLVKLTTNLQKQNKNLAILFSSQFFCNFFATEVWREGLMLTDRWERYVVVVVVVVVVDVMKDEKQ